MRKIKQLIFIPENVQYVTSSEINFQYLSLEEKIKKNPAMREILRAESRKNKTYKKESIKTTNKKTLNTNRTISEGKFDFIKNITKNPILLNFESATETTVVRKATVPKVKSIIIKNVIKKSELTEKQLNSEQVLSLYKNGIIKDIPEEQYIIEKGDMSKTEKEEIEKKEKSLDNMVVDGPAVDVAERGGNVSQDSVSVNIDSGSGDVRSLRNSDESEMNSLINSLVKD